MREWLCALDIKDRNVIGLDLMRSGLSSNRIARVLFFVEDGRIGVVHGFVKKTQKTPADAIALAAKQMKEMKP